MHLVGLHPHRDPLLHQNQIEGFYVLSSTVALVWGLERGCTEAMRGLESTGLCGGCKGSVDGHRGESQAGHVSGREADEMETLSSRGLTLASAQQTDSSCIPSLNLGGSIRILVEVLKSFRPEAL